MGDESLAGTEYRQIDTRHLETGSLKLMLDDYALPTLESLINRIAHAHLQHRSVAIHCVTVTELIFALSALNDAGAAPGDRIEHASVIPEEAMPMLRDAGITVVTQPNFIAERGDQYLADVPISEHHQLYRTGTLLRAGIPLGGGTDAPFGDADPWCAMRAAVNRYTLNGYTLGQQEQISPEQALRLFTSAADNPGGPARSVSVGADADLCLLDRSWQVARTRLQHKDVAATIRAGEVIYQR